MKKIVVVALFSLTLGSPSFATVPTVPTPVMDFIQTIGLGLGQVRALWNELNSDLEAAVSVVRVAQRNLSEMSSVCSQNISATAKKNQLNAIFERVQFSLDRQKNTVLHQYAGSFIQSKINEARTYAERGNFAAVQDLSESANSVVSAFGSWIE